jgi:hypothetical protein
MKRFSSLLAVASFALLHFLNVTPANALEIPWAAYFVSQDKPAPWAQTVRGLGRGKTGVALIEESEQINVGPGSEFARLEEQVKDVITSRDMIIPVGGLRAAKEQDEVNAFMNMIKRDGGKRWKEVVLTQAVRFAKLPHGYERIYWQVGNEINSKAYGTTLNRWAGKGVASGFDDSYIIPLYVEYFLAPTVEALRSASLQVTGSKDKIQVLLGPIANAARPSSRKWLDDLLNYRIRGDFATTLAGERVADAVNMIGIHYVVTSANSDWSVILDDLHHKWVGHSRITGIWSTEELGKKAAEAGLGAATAIRVAARYLHWWGVHSITPKQSRCSFWGWEMGKPGTTGGDGMQALYNFLGDTALKELDRALNVEPLNNLEVYAFQSASDPSKRIMIFFPRKPDEKVNVSQISLKAMGWSEKVKADLHVFSSKGHDIQPLAIQKEQDTYRLSLPGNLALADQAVAVVLATAIK